MLDLSKLTLQKQKIDHAVEALFAEAKGRKLTDEENKTLEEHEKSLGAIEKKLTDAKADTAFADKLAEIAGGDSKDSRIVVARGRAVKSAGQEFIESPAGKWLQENKSERSGSWRAPVVELKATLLESGVTGGPLTIADYSDGGLRIPPLPPSVADLVAPGTTTGNAIGYMRQTPTANPATTVAEGGVKPEATLTFASITDPLRKIATWLPVSDEFLEDVPALRSFIDAQLRAWVREEADDQLLNGDGVAPNLLGFLNIPGIGTLAQGAATALDALALAMAQVQTASGWAATGFVINATDWGKLRLVKTTTGEYLGGNPYGPPVAPTLWGLPVVPTPAIAAGTSLVGAFSIASQLFTKGGIMLAASNSHQDFFIKNLTAIRAEIRAALAVYRPSAFVKVTGLTPPA